MTRYTTCLLTLVLAIAAAGCGDSSDASATSPSSTSPVETTTVNISSSGAVSPSSIRVVAGSRVTMVNNDSRVHDMNSDPHPAHTDCPALNWGSLQPGQSVQSEVLTTARTCGYHDHNDPTNSGLQGTVQVQ